MSMDTAWLYCSYIATKCTYIQYYRYINTSPYDTLSQLDKPFIYSTINNHYHFIFTLIKFNTDQQKSPSFIYKMTCGTEFHRGIQLFHSSLSTSQSEYALWIILTSQISHFLQLSWLILTTHKSEQ